MPPKIEPAEFLWREWVLGRERFAGKGPRSRPRPDFGYGGPGQKKVPPEWWRRLEMFLARQSDHFELQRPGKPTPAPTPVVRATAEQLSAHFNVREFDCHDGRRVPQAAVAALRELCVEVFEPMRLEFGSVQVLSGYRPRDYNRRIGGASLSQHIYEDSPDSVAGDVVFARGTPAQWADAADDLHAGGVGRYDRSGFMHADNRPGRARWTG